MRLRQIALVAADLDPVVDALSGELGADVCFRDPGVGVFGLHNALLPLGDTFCEVVSPVESGTAAGRYLERRGGDGGYMVLLQLDPDERAACRGRAAALGVREVHQAEDDHDGHHIVGTHFHPADTGGAILSVDSATPPWSWGWAGARWRDTVRTERAGAIVAADIQSGRRAELAQQWAELLGRAATADHRILLDQGELRFVEPSDDRGEGLAAFTVDALDPALAGRTTHIGGVRIDWR